MTRRVPARPAPLRSSDSSFAPLHRLLAGLGLSLAAGLGAAQTPPDSAASAPEAAAVVAVPASAAPAPAPMPPAPAPVTALLPPSLGSTDWQTLSPAQRQVLRSLEREWNGLDASHKSIWLEMAARYPSLSEPEQQRLRERMNAWAKLSPEQRQQARLGFQVAQQLKADERQAKWEAYQALPDERKHELAEKAAQKHGQPPLATAGPGKPAAGPAAKANLVPLLPKNQADAPLGPTVLQARPGATTVLVQQSRPTALQPARNTRLMLDTSRLDPNTLLPKPPRAASQTP